MNGVDLSSNTKMCLGCECDISHMSKATKYCNAECRSAHYESIRLMKKAPNMDKCVACSGSLEHRKHGVKFCSSRCQAINRTNKKHVGLVEGIDFIKCPICDQKVGEITPKHSKMHGYKTPKQMAVAYGLKTLKSQKLCDKIKGKNNPAYQHGGTLSPWSKNNTSITENERLENRKKAIENQKGKNPTQVEYWMNEQGMTSEEAEKARSNRQKTFTREICIEKYGTEKGLEIWNERQAKWLKSYKKTNFSKISQDLFWEVVNKIGLSESYYFATYDHKTTDRSEDQVNYEFTLKLNNVTLKPDFIDVEKKLIIEFDGEYWHNKNWRANPERERLRDQACINSGFRVLRIFEKDYKNNKQRELEKCIAFLKQSNENLTI